MTDNSSNKPPTQYAGVVGIEPKPIVLTPEPSQHVNWSAVASLPPFQMYAVERFGRSARDSHEWATECAVQEAAKSGDKALIDAYEAWHAAKGYWPGEDAYGRAR